ncbi:MAG TPA: hypothetical protein VGM38_06920 [Pseudolysinimonas sp.]|jgi:hypothetical protein
MVKRISAAFVALALAVGLSLVAVAPATAEGDSNGPSFYVTPGTSEVCQKFTPTGDITTWSLSSVILPAGMMWTKVIIKAGNTGASGQGPEDHGYYTDPTYKYPAAYADLDWVQVSNLATTTFSHPSGKNISHAIYCYAPAPAVDVAGSASATDQTCSDDTLVGGMITVVITTGVSYSIEDSSSSIVPFDSGTGKTGQLPPGSYTVLVTATAGYHLTSAASIPLVIAPFDGDCAAPVDVAGAASLTNQVCTDGDLVGGVITVTITTGVSYVITDSSNTVIPFDAGTGKTGNLPPGSYSVAVTATTGYHLTSAATIPLTISPYGDDCGQVDSEVTPSATATDETCTVDSNSPSLVSGFITVDIETGIDYTITDSSNALVPFDSGTGKTGPLAPGDYTVHPVAQSGFSLSDSSDIALTIESFDGDCGQLITHPLVDPSAVQVQMGCDTDGSYTLTSDQVDPLSVAWTVNGSPVNQGTYFVPAAGHFVIDATPGTGFGFAFGTQSEWIFDFGLPVTCDLKTLALTGVDPNGGFLLAGFVVLFGLAMMRMGRRVRLTRN